MYSVHALWKGCLALGLLLGVLLLPGEVRAAHKLPTVPELVLAQRLLASAQDPTLREAAVPAGQAILALTGPKGQTLFVVVEGLTRERKGGHRSKDRDDKGSGSSASSSRRSDGQLAVEALALLRAAQTQLEAMKGGPRFQQAIGYVQAAQKLIASFLAQS